MVSKDFERTVLWECIEKDTFLIAAYNNHRKRMNDIMDENVALRIQLTMTGLSPDGYLDLMRREQQEGCLTGNSGTTDRVG